MCQFHYVVELDEEDQFSANIRKESVFSEPLFEVEGTSLVDEGFMKHRFDMKGLKKLLVNYGIMKQEDQISLSL